MKQNVYDTIFASSSPFSSAIKIIRISGEKAYKIPKIFGFKKPEAKTFSLRKLSYNNKVIDYAPVIWLPKNSSFTGEDTYEIYAHGSIIIERLIYDALSSHDGFRQAKAGEFTKRAVLSGNLDLTQAESINDIINAQTEKQLDQAQAQLSGSLSREINQWRKEIVSLASLIESLLDFSDEDIPEEINDLFLKQLIEVSKKIDVAVKNASFSTYIREGFSVVIVGKPNVGKSSLMNTLTKLEASIVSDTPGTTRDVIQQKINLQGLPVTFHDTAGLRKTKNKIEKKGINLALNTIKNSNLILNLSDDGEFYFKEPNLNFWIDNKTPVINVRTKVDLKITNKDRSEIKISSKKNIGINKLLKTIHTYLTNLEPPETSLITSDRQTLYAKKALKALKRIRKLCIVNETELIAEELRLASKCISNITSIIDNEEILDEIFSKFCIGK